MGNNNTAYIFLHMSFVIIIMFYNKCGHCCPGRPELHIFHIIMITIVIQACFMHACTQTHNSFHIIPVCLLPLISNAFMFTTTGESSKKGRKYFNSLYFTFFIVTLLLPKNLFPWIMIQWRLCSFLYFLQIYTHTLLFSPNYFVHCDVLLLSCEFFNGKHTTTPSTSLDNHHPHIPLTCRDQDIMYAQQHTHIHTKEQQANKLFK